jgi:hypothetical protein
MYGIDAGAGDRKRPGEFHRSHSNRNIWQVIGSFSHYFHRFDLDYMLWEISWVNIRMMIFSIEKPDNKTDPGIVDIDFSNISKILKV